MKVQRSEPAEHAGSISASARTPATGAPAGRSLERPEDSRSQSYLCRTTVTNMAKSQSCDPRRPAGALSIGRPGCLWLRLNLRGRAGTVQNNNRAERRV